MLDYRSVAGKSPFLIGDTTSFMVGIFHCHSFVFRENNRPKYFFLTPKCFRNLAPKTPPEKNGSLFFIMFKQNKDPEFIPLNITSDTEMKWTFCFFSPLPLGVSKNTGTPKWMVHNGKPYQNGWFGSTPIFFFNHRISFPSGPHKVADSRLRRRRSRRRIAVAGRTAGGSAIAGGAAGTAAAARQDLFFLGDFPFKEVHFLHLRGCIYKSIDYILYIHIYIIHHWTS